MSSPIKLTDLIPIEDPKQYKLHLACTDTSGDNPLNDYIRNRELWVLE